MESKIRIKMGAVEVEYEGSQEFLKQELPAILDAVAKLYENHATVPAEVLGPSTAPARARVAGATTTTVASKLSVKTGPDLMIAAAAKLGLIDGKDEFAREELHAEMKSAKGFFKTTYTNNFGNYLSSLLKSGRLHEVSKDRFSLPQEVKSELEEKLA